MTVYTDDPTTSVTCTSDNAEVPLVFSAIKDGDMINLIGDNYEYEPSDESLTLQITLDKDTLDELEGAEFICEAIDPTNGTSTGRNGTTSDPIGYAVLSTVSTVFV